jgi:hypothetical protein
MYGRIGRDDNATSKRRYIMYRKSIAVLMMASMCMLLGAASLYAADEMKKPDDMQKQIDALKGALPKFAIPMREVGDRFQNMYFAAKGGNWGLAAYMSKYMNKSMNPASVTKPAEYEVWKNFYEQTFAPVNKAINAEDLKAFEKQYMAVIKSCNECHKGMGYGFIQVVKMKESADQGINYKVKSKAADVPK